MKKTMNQLIKKIQLITMIPLLVVGIIGALSFMNAKPVFAAQCRVGDDRIPTSIFVPWYAYLECDSNGNIQIGDWESALPLIIMAVIALLTRIAGLIAVGFIIWGGIQYITSQGEPNGVAVAKSTLTNAIIGFVITVSAFILVDFIAGLIRTY